MEGAKNMIEVWSVVMVSLCYCYTVGNMVPKGIKRLILVTPVVFAFFLLPLRIYSVHFGGATVFFLAWLSNFKLFLFAFGRGPLCPDSTNPLSLPMFLVVSCLPVNPILNSDGHKSRPDSREGPVNYAIKGSLLVLVIKIYDYNERIPHRVVLALYAVHIYFLLELILAAAAAVVRATLGLELEPQFKEPYLATSLQDFWGRRWNLMVSSILRPTVYEPSLRLFSAVFGKTLATLPAVFSTFVVSALMHELIFFYIGRLRPSWEVTGFFLLHGLCTATEIAVKKAIRGSWRLPTAVARVLTVGFVLATAVWLFLPEFERCNIVERAFGEYAALGASLNRIAQRLQLPSGSEA